MEDFKERSLKVLKVVPAVVAILTLFCAAVTIIALIMEESWGKIIVMLLFLAGFGSLLSIPAYKYAKNKKEFWLWSPIFGYIYAIDEGIGK